MLLVDCGQIERTSYVRHMWLICCRRIFNATFLAARMGSSLITMSMKAKALCTHIMCGSPPPLPLPLPPYPQPCQQVLPILAKELSLPCVALPCPPQTDY